MSVQSSPMLRRTAVAAAAALLMATGGLLLVAPAQAAPIGADGLLRDAVPGAGAQGAAATAAAYAVVVNDGANSVTEYDSGANGNQVPFVSISGPDTGLDQPDGAAMDPARNLFVANFQGGTVTEYAPGATGDATPIATISGSATGLANPAAVALDPAGDLFVANSNSGGFDSVIEYAPGAAGNVAPIAVIQGSSTRLSVVQGLAVDPAGDLFVTTFHPGGFDSVIEYAPGATGNVAPVATISGSATGLTQPEAIALDAAGDLFVANPGTNSVTEYASGATGNATPIATVAGSATGLSQPDGVALDAAGDLFVTNHGTNSVTEYAPGATGNATPAATISGSGTGLNFPSGLVVAPSSAPPAPVIGQLTPGNGAATATFTPLTVDGGSAITAYTATATDLTNPAHGGQTQTGAGNPITVTGLSNGDSYTVSVTATNAVGTGPASQASNSVTSSVAAGTPYSFVANEINNSITEYARGATGDQVPLVTISGSATGLKNPVDVALDSAGNLFVANYTTNSVTEYAPSASGNTAPIATISGSATGLRNPATVLLDPAGNLFVVNQGANSITQYAPGATGNAPPVTTIQGSGTQLSQPQGLAIDAAGDLFVSNFQTNSVTEYTPGSTGNVPPVATISGSDTAIQQPEGLALDPTGHLFVSNTNSSVTEYAPGATGDAAPITTIQGANTGLTYPVDLALDPATADVFVPNLLNNSVTVYAKGTTGNQAPSATISGPNTGLSQPEGVALAAAPAATAPGAPTVGTAAAGDAQATVTFSPPSADGGSMITGYTVTASPGGRTATGSTSPITVTGLTNGTSYTFTVTATNSAGTGPASDPSNPVTPAAALAISTTSLPGGTVGNSYATTLSASGGTTPYRWSLAAGSFLPAGLTLSPDGAIAGNPAVAGTGSFTVQVTDSASPAQTATKNLSVTIKPAPAHADLAIAATHLGNFVTGRYGWYKFTVTNTGTAATTSVTTVSSVLPRGLTPTWASGMGWTCRGNGQSGSCTHAAGIGAKHSTTVMLLVRITAAAGQSLATTGIVAPTDTTPADNTTTDHVRIQPR